MQINSDKKGWPEPSFYLSSAFYGMAYSKVAPKIIICLGIRCQRKKGKGGNVLPPPVYCANSSSSSACAILPMASLSSAYCCCSSSRKGESSDKHVLISFICASLSSPLLGAAACTDSLYRPAQVSSACNSSLNIRSVEGIMSCNSASRRSYSCKSMASSLSSLLLLFHSSTIFSAGLMIAC